MCLSYDQNDVTRFGFASLEEEEMCIPVHITFSKIIIIPSAESWQLALVVGAVAAFSRG